MKEFRKLRADEIDVRVGHTKDSGMGLLLYKDARVDMNILDETVEPINWQRDHKEIKGNVYCGVSIKINADEWVTKWDAGSESNTEAVKGEASDSFKRACVNWGIGRELYTAPFIWVTGYGKYEKFKVSEIDYNESGIINNLVIVDNKGKVAYSYSDGNNQAPKQSFNNMSINTQEPQNFVREDSRASESIMEQVQEADKEYNDPNHLSKNLGGQYGCNACNDGILEPQYYQGNPWLTKDGSKWKHKCNVCGRFEWIKVEDVKQ